MSFDEEKIRKYNAPMANRIAALRKRYSRLYQMDADRFDALFHFEARMGVIRGEFHSREELMKKLDEWLKRH